MEYALVQHQIRASPLPQLRPTDQKACCVQPRSMNAQIFLFFSNVLAWWDVCRHEHYLKQINSGVECQVGTTYLRSLSRFNTALSMSEAAPIDTSGGLDVTQFLVCMGLLPLNTPPEPYMTIVPQTRYQPRQYTGPLHAPMQFECLLSDALNQDMTGLINHDARAFSPAMRLPQKMSIVFQFCGYDSRYSRQVHILRAHSTPPTRGQLAIVVAREVHRFLNRGTYMAQTGAAQAGKPLQFGGRYIIGLEDLVLVDVQHVSKSTLQPTIAIRTQALA
ncbi:hypothetical protein C8Q73DRAFT_782189 [Cubamyces lactineus]|nr:hypothetical protein C8Q73DRAFT_782189 [Cubamyces lactineus]